MLMDPQLIKYSYLRLLTFSIPVSLIYDLVWLFSKSDEYWSDESENGMTQVILVLIFIVFFYKIFLFGFMWKASLNF